MSLRKTIRFLIIAITLIFSSSSRAEHMGGGHGLVDFIAAKEYPRMVKHTLQSTQLFGLPENHYYYITFETSAPGVYLSESLLTQYPNKMTIVLQYQFWKLKVAEEYFSVYLTFDDTLEKLTIPFEAITDFHDPSIDLWIQLKPEPKKISPAKIN